MEDEENYEMIFKIVLIGDSFVGKSNILSKYLKNEFNEDSKATVGVEFGSKATTIEGHSIKVQIWDTAGQERYKAITNAYYKGALGAFLVYDITRKETFDNVDKWISELKTNGSKNISILIIGNKCDLDDKRQITKADAEQKAKNYNVAYMETSALSGENIEVAFETIIKGIYDKCHTELEEKNKLEIEKEKPIDIGTHKHESEQIKKSKLECCKQT